MPRTGLPLQIYILCICAFSVVLPNFPRYHKQIFSFRTPSKFYVQRLHQKSNVE